MSSVPLPAPRPAYIPQVSASSSPGISPWNSPPSSRPPSPVRAAPRSASAAPSAASSSGWNTADHSRSSSHSKDPLFKKSRAEQQGATGGVGGGKRLWIQLQKLAGRRGEEDVPRGRRPSVANEGGERLAPTSAKEPTSEPSPSLRGGWLTAERAQLTVSFAMIGLVGMNDSATGANLDSMREHYGVTYDLISLVFLAIVAGYFVSCLGSSFLTHLFGVRYTLHVACAVFAVATITLSFAPPFGAFIFALALLGFGGGLMDAVITVIISHAEDGALMSYTYAWFGVGATFAPLIIGSFVDKGYKWNQYYYVPFGISVLLAIASHFAFRNFVEPADETSAHLEMPLELSTVPSHTNAPSSPALHTTISRQQPLAQDAGTTFHGRAKMSVRTRMARALKMPVVWIGFVLIILAFGTGDTASGYSVTYVLEVKHSPPAAARYMLSGLWGGIASGRIILAYLLDSRLGERTFSIVMLTLAAVFLGLLWAIKNYVVNALMLVLIGFFLGPVTPKVLSTISARVPPSLKSSVMSLTIGLGLVGSAVGPLFFGFVAGKGYIASLPGVLIVCSVVAMAVWALVPANKRRED